MRLMKDADDESKAKLRDLEKSILKRKEQFRELEDVLPHENGWKIVIRLLVIENLINVYEITISHLLIAEDQKEDMKLSTEQVGK